MREIKLFDIVKSLAGHDKEETFVVSEIVDNNYCKIINGKTRKLSNPKLKKKKHLKFLISANAEFEALKNNKLNDALVRKIIKEKMGELYVERRCD